MSQKEVFLEGNPPWGFRMNGGADAGHPLRISRVNPGSKAEAKGVREGDLITSINGQSTKCLTNSESHALLRTVKENLLLGLNEDKNASPRRRSREIKSASFISQEKDRSESPAQSKGNKKPSANQKRHQRRTRLKHRIKEMFGLKNKEKLEQDDDDWVIIDKSLKVETKSLTNSLPDEEERHTFIRSSSEPVSNASEEVYDNFEFNSKKTYLSDKKNIPTSSYIPTLEKNMECCQCITAVGNYNTDEINPQKNQDSRFKESEIPNQIQANDPGDQNTKYIQKYSVVVETVDDFIKSESKMPADTSNTTKTAIEAKVLPIASEQSARQVYIPEGDRFSETLNPLHLCQMVEVCNATILTEEDKMNETSAKQSNPVISLVDVEQCQIIINQNLNPDYEPVEVNSSVIIYPPYSSTLSYYFPQRRFLEAIVEENSDVSENNDEKHEKPWENSHLIREANNIESIPDDWCDSDEGIDTSWRDGQSIEEVTDVPIVTDSHSDSDFLNEDAKACKLKKKDETSDGKLRDEVPLRSNPKKNDVVLGKPPINTVNTYRISGWQTNKPFTISKTVSQSISKLVTPQHATSSDFIGNKVTCRLLKENGNATEVRQISKEVLNEHENSIKNYENQKVPITQVQGGQKIQIQESTKFEKNETKLECKVIDASKAYANTQSPDYNKQSENLSKGLLKVSNCQGSLGKFNSNFSKSYMKTTPSTSVLKNVVSSYYNSASFPEKVNLSENHDHAKPKESIKLSTDVIEPGLVKDIELIYIDSSDSDAISNKSNISPSNRTSLLMEKEDIDTLEASTNIVPSNDVQTSNNTGHIIKEVITNINQSVKEISDICADTAKNKKSRDKPILKSKGNNVMIKPSELPNLLSPVLGRKCLQTKQKVTRRFSYPFSEQDIHKNYNTINCYHFENSTSSNQPNNKVASSSSLKLSSETSKHPQAAVSVTKMIQSEDTQQDLNLKSSLTSYKDESKSAESIFLDFSEGSISSESYTLPDVSHDNELLSDVSTDTIKYFGIPPSSPRFVPRSPVEVSDIVDLHKKFVERRGYHEASPTLKRKQEEKKTTEPDLIALSKCQERNEQAYTPELLAEAANLIALHKYHESRQKKMRQEGKDNIGETLNQSDDSAPSKKQDQSVVVKINKETNVVNPKEEFSDSAQCGVNELTKDNSSNKSFPAENEAVGKSRLLELFQKLELKSSSSDCTNPEPFPYCLILDEPLAHDVEDCGFDWNLTSSNNVNKYLQCSDKIEENIKSPQGIESNNSSSANLPRAEVTIRSEKSTTSTEARSASLPTGEIFQRKMYEEYLGKMAELADRRSSKVIKLSSIPKNINPPCDSQPLESEFMNKLKQRNEKLGIVIDSEDNCEDIKKPAPAKQDLPNHLKELMEITEECGGVWSPAQTPEAERKKFDFCSERKEEKEKKNEGQKEPQPPVWTPRSAGASPTLERKFRSVNFQSPPPTRKEIKTSNEETPELPHDLPPDSDKDTKSRLTSSSSENSTLSSSLRLPAAQNPTITLLQKAREGQIPRGAQYLEEQPIIGPNEIIYSVKKEHVSEDQSKKIVELGPRKIEGIGPTTKEGIPTVLRSEVKEDNQQRWYKRMYDSLHKADYDKDFVTVKYKTKRRGQYPYIYSGGYSSEPERVGYDSDASLSKYATLDRRKIRNKENDFTTSTMPRNRYAPGVKYAVNIYKNQPGRIEDYEPGHSSIAERETKQWWDEVMDIFDGELNHHSRHNHISTKTSGKPFIYSLKDTGYESDSTLVFKRRENNMNSQLLSPADQKMAYKVIQKGGEVPLQGLRKAAPERPKEPLGNPIPTPPRDSTSRQRIQESPHRYVESEVNIHYRSPVRREAKAAWPEDELAQRQAEIMRRIYQEQKRTKYLNELHDMYSRRHADNLLPSQKSPIPLNRYDDFPVEPQPPRPRDRTPEPKLVARALYNFVGQTSRELSFRRGDIIYVRRQIDKNWYEGEHNAMVGLFPFNYVEIIPYDGIRTLPKKANEGQARAKFNFQAQTHLELSLVKGELVLLTRRVDENWFEGRIGNRKGIFPVSYVEVLVEPGERAVSPSSGISPSKPIVAPASHSVMLNGAKDLGQQHYQPPRPAIYASSSLPPSSKINDISLVNQTLHIDTQSDPVPYRVMYNYRPQNEDELELKEGDIVYVMEKCDDGWYVGSLHRNGQFGTFPGNYVERIQ